jgi:NTE family protein
MKKRKKLGVALGSGGPKGLYHIGVLKTLIKNRIPIDYIAGSSIGSWIGAYYALYRNVDRLEELTNGRKFEKLVSMLEFSLNGGLIKGDKFELLIKDWLKDARFVDLKIPFRAVTTDLITGEPVIFRSGKLAPILRASMAVPGAFAPVVHQNRILTDGGISNPVPCDIVRSMGADVILAVDLNGISEKRHRHKVKYDKNIGDILGMAINILYYHLAIELTKDADFVLRPELQKYASWKDYFFENEGGKIIAIGERDTRKLIPTLRKKLEE